MKPQPHANIVEEVEHNNFPRAVENFKAKLLPINTFQMQIALGLIHVPHSMGILLKFTGFETEKCCDFVKIYNGFDNSAPRIASLSGNTLPDPIQVNSDHVFVEFTSDRSTQLGGFNATYSALSCSNTTCLDRGICYQGACTCFNQFSGERCEFCSNQSPHVFTESVGTLTTNLGPEYANNAHCQFQISPLNAMAVTLNVTKLSLESGSDTITVYDGLSVNAPKLVTLTGSELPSPSTIVSSSPNMLVVFHSDRSVNSGGFEANYTAMYCQSSSETCNNNGFCHQGQCVCYNGFSGAHCNFCDGNMFLSSASGSFQAAFDASVGYENNANCQWLIQHEPSDHVELMLFNVSTEQSNDKITVYDGATTAAQKLLTLSGNPTGLHQVTSSSATMLVTFESDGSVTEPGFGFVANFSTGSCYANCYNAGCCDATKTDGQCNCALGFGGLHCGYCDGFFEFAPSMDNGNFTSNRAPTDYLPNSDCQWLIAPSNGAPVSLSFPSFETESNNDVVKVYDGKTSSAPLLATLSGDDISPQSSIVAKSGTMFVEFTSDSSVQQSGFTGVFETLVDQQEQTKKPFIIN
eukprot:CAMPEP_0201552900 /NCGR_PEP_ID=MMETSP0173_2-20130828/19217_1 /ASSEMBLY_ACC=CAM_ASM_000268 /TAXON_ID=218659 /ORGANISM="Vexillifera sp., Strain DIVA3 564/2" /LENGTH=578 /DNA_ID=CAMNT_0047963485 /DNA_START=187 /DNA_END=1922 /DNA_ORIENTATION=+